MTKTDIKHTPGPWEIAQHYDAPNTYCPFITVGPAQVRFTQGYFPETDPERKARAEADACLIAEAPAMLEALRTLILAADADGIPAGWGCVVDPARAILARIDGGDETVCASCGAPEGESHAATCEARAFSAGVRARIDGEA